MGTPPRTAVRRLALARAISETGSAAAYTALLDAVFIRSGGSAAWLGVRRASRPALDRRPHLTGRQPALNRCSTVLSFG
jgi:hypothetical protein